MKQDRRLKFRAEKDVKDDDAPQSQDKAVAQVGGKLQILRGTKAASAIAAVLCSALKLSVCAVIIAVLG